MVVGYYLEVDFVDVLLLGLVEEVDEHYGSKALLMVVLVEVDV